MMPLADFLALDWKTQTAEIDRNPLKRGNHAMPHQSQILRRDLHGEQIARSFGATAMGYTLTDEQLKDKRHGLPYRYLIYSPKSCAMNWTAFYTLAELRDFAAAYDLAIEPAEPTPGERFDVRLPDSAANWQPTNGETNDRYLGC
jgi:hypothetical protein